MRRRTIRRAALVVIAGGAIAAVGWFAGERAPVETAALQARDEFARPRTIQFPDERSSAPRPVDREAVDLRRGDDVGGIPASFGSPSSTSINPTERGFETPTAWIDGLVIDDAREPVHGAWVVLGDRFTRTAQDGTFAIMDRLTPTRRTIIAVSAGKLPARVDTDGGAGSESTAFADPVVLKLGEEPLSIDVAVVNARGLPVRSARVWLIDPTPLGDGDLGRVYVEDVCTMPPDRALDPGIATMTEGRTGNDGTARFRGLSPRSYRIGAMNQVSLQVTTSKPILPGDGPVTLTIGDGRQGVFRGRVVTEAGHAVQGAKLVARPASGGPRSDVARRSTRSDSNGYFAITGIEIDDLAVEVHSANGRKLEQVRQDVRRGDEDVEITVREWRHVRLSKDGLEDSVDQLGVRDEDGTFLPLGVAVLSFAVEPGTRIPVPSSSLDGFDVPDHATELVLFAGEVEVRSIPIEVPAFGVLVVPAKR